MKMELDDEKQLLDLDHKYEKSQLIYNYAIWGVCYQYIENNKQQIVTDQFIDYWEERKSWRKTRWHMFLWKAIIKVERVAAKIIAILWTGSFPTQSLLQPILQLAINLSENAWWRETPMWCPSLDTTKCNWRCHSCFPMKLHELIPLKAIHPWDFHSANTCGVWSEKANANSRENGRVEEW